MFARSVLALIALLCLLVWLSRPRDEQIVVLPHRHDVPGAKIAPLPAPSPPPNLEIAINVAVTAAGADALRRVAHARAVDLGRGPELLTTFTDLSVGGGALALNALANIHALGYRHHLVGGYAAHVCAELGAAVRRGRPVGWETMLRTPCVRDSWWEAHVGAARRRVALSARSGVWFIRWSIVARLVRLGYNVLNVDADVALLDDVVRHLHSDLICGRFALSFASDYDVGQPWLQNGIVYACGAARDGAAAWVLAEEVDRYLRLCDACGGWQDGDSDDAAATRPCPAGSWLHGARGYSAFSFDSH